MEFHIRMYGVSRRMCYVGATYVWRMKCTRDVSTRVIQEVMRTRVSFPKKKKLEVAGEGYLQSPHPGRKTT